MDPVQAEEQIGAKTLRRDVVLQIPIRRRDHVHVDADVGGAAHAFEALLVEEPQQLGLERQGHPADLVDQYRPAISHLEQPLLPGARLSEGAALVAEQVMFTNGLAARSPA